MGCFSPLKSSPGCPGPRGDVGQQAPEHSVRVARRPLASIRCRTSTSPPSPPWAESAHRSQIFPVRAAAVGPRARGAGREQKEEEPSAHGRSPTGGGGGAGRARTGRRAGGGAGRRGAGRRPAQPWRTRALGRAASLLSWAAPTVSRSPRRWPVAPPNRGARAAPGSWSSRTSEVGALR